jgi:hypothetical protein
VAQLQVAANVKQQLEETIVGKVFLRCWCFHQRLPCLILVLLQDKQLKRLARHIRSLLKEKEQLSVEVATLSQRPAPCACSAQLKELNAELKELNAEHQDLLLLLAEYVCLSVTSRSCASTCIRVFRYELERQQRTFQSERDLSVAGVANFVATAAAPLKVPDVTLTQSAVASVGQAPNEPLLQNVAQIAQAEEGKASHVLLSAVSSLSVIPKSSATRFASTATSAALEIADHVLVTNLLKDEIDSDSKVSTKPASSLRSQQTNISINSSSTSSINVLRPLGFSKEMFRQELGELPDQYD